MVHALGPGHGKTITFSYFLSERANIKKGIIVGGLIGFLHAGSALIVILSLYFIIKQSFLSSFEDISRVIRLISYGLITLIGLLLLVKTIIELKRQGSSGNHIHDSTANTKSIVPFSIAVGMIPCTGTVIILLFSISMDVLTIGMISTFFMGLGMATTISLVGISTIATKQGISRFVFTESKMRTIFQNVVSLVGTLLIIFLGVFLFTGAI